MSVYAARRLGLLLTLLAVFAFWILRIVKDPASAPSLFAFAVYMTLGPIGPMLLFTKPKNTTND